MQIVRAMRLLSVPAAVVLGTALAVACSGGTPTSPDQVQAGPLFATSKDAKVDDSVIPGTKPCPGGYTLGIADPNDPVDVNLNGQVCFKNGGGGAPKKK